MSAPGSRTFHGQRHEVDGNDVSVGKAVDDLLGEMPFGASDLQNAAIGPFGHELPRLRETLETCFRPFQVPGVRLRRKLSFQVFGRVGSSRERIVQRGADGTHGVQRRRGRLAVVAEDLADSSSRAARAQSMVLALLPAVNLTRTTLGAQCRNSLSFVTPYWAGREMMRISSRLDPEVPPDVADPHIEAGRRSGRDGGAPGGVCGRVPGSRTATISMPSCGCSIAAGPNTCASSSTTQPCFPASTICWRAYGKVAGTWLGWKNAFETIPGLAPLRRR